MPRDHRPRIAVGSVGAGGALIKHVLSLDSWTRSLEHHQRPAILGGVSVMRQNEWQAVKLGRRHLALAIVGREVLVGSEEEEHRRALADVSFECLDRVEIINVQLRRAAGQESTIREGIKARSVARVWNVWACEFEPLVVTKMRTPGSSNCI